MRALLLSNSTNPAMDPLSHARTPITDLLGGVDTLVFVPYALADWDGYTKRSREALSGVCHVVGAHRLAGDEFEEAGAYFVGGGNTFRLLRKLQNDRLVETIVRRVGDGTPYVGASAGSAIAGPSLRTTNDMPIVEPGSFAALGLVGFHLNCR
ncbi:MAG: dipeptidase PepE [Acidimicrobiales bacterium]